MDFKVFLKWGFVLFFVFVLVLLYRTYNPIGNLYFPKCPFRVMTGLKCPGCGSQRAIHYLLNLDILSALKENVVLVISIPYIVAGIVFDSLKKPNENTLKWRKILFGRKAIFVILAIIIVFWVLRNIIGC